MILSNMWMKLWNIFLTHNRPWTLWELVVFGSLLAMVSGVIWRMKKQGKISRSQALAGTLLALFLVLVFASTVFTRMPARRSYELMPLWSWQRVLTHGDTAILQENLLNILLFVPIGILLFFVSQKLNLRHACLIGFSISFLIEVCQLVLCRGLFEWDDMVHNTLGCGAGFWAMRWWHRLRH